MPRWVEGGSRVDLDLLDADEFGQFADIFAFQVEGDGFADVVADLLQSFALAEATGQRRHGGNETAASVAFDDNGKRPLHEGGRGHFTQ